MASAMVKIARDKTGKAVRFIYVPDRGSRSQSRQFATRRVKCGGGYRVLGKTTDGGNY